MLKQLTQDMGHIKERGAGPTPGYIDTTANVKPEPEATADAEDRATLFDEINSVAGEAGPTLEPVVAPGQTPKDRYKLH